MPSALAELETADLLRDEYRRRAAEYPSIRDPHERRFTYRRLLGLLVQVRTIEGHTGPFCGMTAVLPPWVYD